jgi:hypothetical protein
MLDVGGWKFLVRGLRFRVEIEGENGMFGV